MAAEAGLPDDEHRAAFRVFLADYEKACEAAGMKKKQANLQHVRLHDLSWMAEGWLNPHAA